MLVGSEIRVVSCSKCSLHQGLAITVAKVRVRRDFLVLGVRPTTANLVSGFTCSNPPDNSTACV